MVQMKENVVQIFWIFDKFNDKYFSVKYIYGIFVPHFWNLYHIFGVCTTFVPHFFCVSR